MSGTPEGSAQSRGDQGLGGAGPGLGGGEPERRLAKPRGLTELEDLDAVFAALAHRSRRTILAVLRARGGEMTSGEIAARFDHSWPTTSQHLRVLQNAGLVTVALRGREHVYRLDAARMRSVAGGWLARFADNDPVHP